VEVFINDKSWGVREPNPETKRCTWENLIWQAGKVKAVGMDINKKVVCSDSIETSGEPYAIVLEVEKPLTAPIGKTFYCTANGSDATIITAKVVDSKGRWCPLANNTITFKVEGYGVYCGSYDFYITDSKPATYHSPFDKELQMEGGLRRIAIRSTFTPGIVQVAAISPGLKNGEVSFNVTAVEE
jgi:beta-galactosidase